MSRKIILNLAVSLDGYIADEAGGYAWIKDHDSRSIDTSPRWEHSAFLKQIALVVMGKTCYDQGFAADYADKLVYVATTQDLQDHDHLRFVRGDICAQMRAECAKEGGDIYLFGGGKLCDSFIKANMVDEYIIGIVPVILGRGIPLFLGENPTIPLQLKERHIDSGIVVLRYQK